MKKSILLVLAAFTLMASYSCTNNEGDDSIEVITPVDDTDSEESISKPN